MLILARLALQLGLVSRISLAVGKVIRVLD
jgi:hypothetical protein